MIGKKMRIPLVLLAACSLAGCGTTKPDRVTGGAVTGAIAGGGPWVALSALAPVSSLAHWRAAGPR